MFTVKLDDIPEEGLAVNWEERRNLFLATWPFPAVDFVFETPLQAESRIKKIGKILFDSRKRSSRPSLPVCQMFERVYLSAFSSFDLTLHPLKARALRKRLSWARGYGVGFL